MVEHLGQLHIAGFRLKLIGLAAAALFSGAAACSPVTTSELPASTHYHALTGAGDRLIVIAHDGLYESLDGKSFEAIKGPGSHLLSATSDGGLIVGGQTGAWRKTSGGWSPIANWNGRIVQGVTKSASGLHAWLVGDGLTNIEGVSAKGSGPDDGLASLTSDGDVLYAGGPNFGAFKSDDRGSTWTDLHAPSPVTALSASNGHLYAGAVDGLWSYDAGRWTKLPLDPGGPVAAIATWTDALWVIGQGGVLHRSNDNGQTWTVAATSTQ